MKFEEIIPALREGCSIRHVSWPKEYSVYMKDGCLHDQQCRLFDMMNSGMINWLSTDGWKIFEKPKIDWSYIIENKCLCLFWDSDSEKKFRYLKRVDSRKTYPYKDEFGYAWKNCRPVHRDEINFYEDRKENSNEI